MYLTTLRCAYAVRSYNYKGCEMETRKCGTYEKCTAAVILIDGPTGLLAQFAVVKL